MVSVHISRRNMENMNRHPFLIPARRAPVSEPKYNCQTCGACCVQLGPHDGNAYVYLDREEAGRMRSFGLPVVRGFTRPRPQGGSGLPAASSLRSWGAIVSVHLSAL